MSAITLRSGFYSYNMVATLNDLGVDYSITVPLYTNVRAAIEAIAEKAWTSIKYRRGGEAQVAETTIWVTHRTKRKRQIKLRLVVRRTRLTDQDQDQAQLQLCRLALPPLRDQHRPPHGRDHPHQHTDTDTDTDTDRKRRVEADRHHRRHATIELAIRDLKGAAGLAHLPSGRFWANAAWLAITTLAHNLYRWIAHLGRIQPPNKLTAGTTIRNRLFGIPARSTTADDTSCAYPPNGPGPTPTKPPSPTSATYPNSPDHHPHNHTTPPLNQPLRNRTPTRPDTPPKYPRPSTPNPTTPPNPHQPPTNPQNNPHQSVDSG